MEEREVGLAIRLDDWVAPDHWRGDVTMYKLTPPYDERHWGTHQFVRRVDHVVVSTVYMEGLGWETVAFACDSNGNCPPMSSISASETRGANVSKCLAQIGYEVAT